MFACTWSGGWSEKSFFPHLAALRFSCRMCSKVPGQVADSGKLFFTHLATICFFSSMCSHVPGQVTGSGNSFSTLLAEISFSLINFHVFSTIRVFCKTFFAWKTQKYFCVSCIFVCLIGDNVLTKHSPVGWQCLFSSDHSRVVSGNDAA